MILLYSVATRFSETLGNPIGMRRKLSVSQRAAWRERLHNETELIMKEWHLSEPQLQPRYDGPRARPLREIVNAIVYVLRDGDVFEKINRRLFMADREPAGREADQNFKPTGAGGSRGADPDKDVNGRERRASGPRGSADRRPQDVQPGHPDPAGQTGQEGMTVIRKTPGIRGGAACIGDSRVPVWIIVLMSEAGAGVGEMLGAYPQLTPTDCAAALNYALLHRAEIDADIAWG